MKVRDRLLLSYGAVLLVAVLGLILGLAGVLGISVVNERAVRANLHSLQAASSMRAIIGKQQTILLEKLADDDPTRISDFMELGAHFRDMLKLAREQANTSKETILLNELGGRYDDLMISIVGDVEGVVVGDAGPDQVSAFERLREQALTLYEMNMSEIEMASANALFRFRIIAGLMALTALATFIIGVLVSRRLALALSEPLEHLSHAATQVAGGEFDTRVTLGDIDELNTLAKQFNTMTQALQQFHALNIGSILREQKRNEAVLNSIDEGLIIGNGNGRIEQLNPVAALQLGRSMNAAIGSSITELLPASQLAEQIQAVLDPTQEEVQAGELSIGDGDGARTLSYSLSRVIAGELMGWVLVLRDITNQRVFERLRTEFVLRASHELRTPLTGMRMAIELLQKQAPFDPASRPAELLATLHEEMQRMQKLVTDLLDLSRLYTKSLELDLAPVQLGDLLTSACQRFAANAEAQNVQLHCDINAAAVTHELDRIRFERVLDNLISNALRHTPAGGEIRLALHTRHDLLQISVSDTGDGIPLHVQQRVFEPFFQVGANQGGSGLGLAMCKEIVEQHHGSIRLRSTPGQGARFIIELPR